MARGPRSNWERHVGGVGKHLRDLLLAPPHRRTVGEKIFLLTALLLALGGATLGTLAWAVRRPPLQVPTGDLLETLLPRDVDLTLPARPEPARFPARSHMPPRREELVSGPPGLRFFPKHDLVRVEDERVWWESDNDQGDTEDDHVMHRSLEEPFRRLIELVARERGILKVQDTYREEGIHAAKSLHKEGRAIDLTCDELGLEKLARLAWAAGFDWVYHEVPRNGGAHVHASVRADRPHLARDD